MWRPNAPKPSRPASVSSGSESQVSQPRLTKPFMRATALSPAVASVLRDYGLRERTEAPKDSREAHGR